MSEKIELQSTANDLEKAPKNSKCLVCKEDIRYGAKKCTKCESFQDWRRYFQFNIVVLSLLVALFSVVATSVPVIKSVVLPEADVRFSFLHFNSKHIVIVATNIGRRAAVLKEVKLNMVDKQNGDIRDLPLVVRGDAGKKEIIIAPDKWTVLSFTPSNPEDSFDLIEPADYRSCQLDFFTLDLNHEPKRFSINMDCDKVTGKNSG
jgi:hypothetical protein